MSELDTALHALRDELTESIPLPDVEHVTGAARIRRRRQLGAIAAVVAVAVAVPVIRALPPVTTTPAAPPVPRTTTQYIDFADPDHGYALTRRCASRDQGCVFTLLRTTDGGRDWRPVSLPATANPRTGYFSAPLYVLGPDEVVIDQQRGMMRERSHSVDGGRTWRVVENWWGGPTPAPLVPERELVGECLAQPTGDWCPGIGQIDPATGRYLPAPGQPPLDLQEIGQTATSGGRWWATGRHETTGRLSLSVSSDAGATWSTTDLGLSAPPSLDGWAVVERNGVMYATATNARALLGVWRSIDDGRSWTRTWAPGADDHLPGMAGTPVAAGDGSLALCDGTTTYVSTDQGGTFARTGDTTTPATWTRAGYLRGTNETFALSTDGLHWRTFTLG